MKIWVDDIRPAPEGYNWCKTVNDAIYLIEMAERLEKEIEVIDLDHDASTVYSKYGGDYIKILDWLEEKEKSYPIHIHSQNAVGVQNMRAIIQRNNWVEV